MSLSEDVLLVGDRLIRLIDAGVAVKDAAVEVGVTRARAYAVLQRTGHRVGAPRRPVGPAVAGVVTSVFARTGSIRQAAKAAEIAHSTARRILVESGVVAAHRTARGKPEAKRRFVELVECGWSTSAASREVGVHPRTGRDWWYGTEEVGDTRRLRDGTVTDHTARTRYNHQVTPTSGAVRDVSARYLSLDDRIAIADGVSIGLSITDISARIGRHKSTISREIRAHRAGGLYLPYRAHRGAAAARARPKASKLTTNGALREQVQNGLDAKFSPEQISNRLRKDFPTDESMRVSHETIYQALYVQARGGLKKQVQQALRSGRTRRRPHRSIDGRTPRFVEDMIMISERPAEVEDRAVPGHWEGDLIVGAANGSAIGTLVERTTRYTLLVHLPGNHDAETVRDGLVATIAELPAHLRGSLTWDQGCEMARHTQFTAATDMAVYFCDPHSPWQRGTNENTNGLLRQYFPKGTDLSVHGPAELEYVAQELNGRPRKTLDWDTPAERLRDLLTR